MRFVTAFKNSLWNLPWLKVARHFAGSAWQYFFLFCLVMTVVIVLPIAVAMPSAFRDVRDRMGNAVPAFEAELKGGSLHVTGLQQPFISREDDLVLIVDTVATSSLSVQQFLTTGESGLLVTSAGMQLWDANQAAFEEQSWRNFPDYRVTRDQAVQLVGKLANPKFIIITIVLLLLGTFIGLVLSKLWLILWVSLIVFIINKFANQGWRFTELFVVGLYAITLPSILTSLLRLIGLGMPLLSFLALLAFMLAVVFTKDDNTVENNRPDAL